ncbi:dipeptide/oligopeptide/nickel ABC transporter permease/ATP-binding protein [Kribbella sp. NPDC049227]|uniref:dipeptide/oligopeptide/nickel ABC transporter permease/ATP-binding protein n=1 Tax=Kribbella sp. NPDC049227 TaxID=3364113 RepID=UPI00371961AA
MTNLYLRAFWRDRSGVLALGVALAVLALAVLGPVLFGHAATRTDTLQASAGVSGAHWLGTDDLGRDVLARTLVATRLSLVLAVTATAIAAVVGAGLGLVLSGLPASRLRRACLSALNVVLAFPPIIVAIFIAAILGVGAWSAATAVGLAVAPRFARVTHSVAASVTSRDYISAVRTLGLSRARVLFRHVLPNAADTLWVAAFLETSGALLFISALSFLGLGVQPLDYDWGSLLTSGLNSMYTTPAAVLGPTVMIVLTGIAFGYLGEAVARAANPERWAPIRSPRPVRTRVDGLPARSVATTDSGSVLQVRDLTVTAPAATGAVALVDGVSFVVDRQEAVGIVGESGSGKSLTLMSIAGLTSAALSVSATDLQVLGRERRDGQDIAVVFQDPTNSLNPALRIRTQMTEGLRAHRGLSKKQAAVRAVRALADVRLTSPELRMRQYPHQLSGGMRQRVSIAMGSCLEPSLLLADEPTTALDVTTQRQVLNLLQALRERGMGIVLVSHDMAVVAEICDRLLVMYAGRVVEEGPAGSVLRNPRHPYTRGLLECLPDVDERRNGPLATIPGTPPQPGEIEHGCAFAPRCSLATEVCERGRPELVEWSPGSSVACWAVNPVDALAEVAR